MSARDNLHPQLFDTTPYERKKTPGEMSPDEWMTHHGDDVQYHGTFRGHDWTDAPTVHSGTIGQAVMRLDHAATSIKHSPIFAHNYYTPDAGYDSVTDTIPDEPTTPHEGRIHAFRMAGGVYRQPVTDAEANDADYRYQILGGAESHQVSKSVKDSMSDAGNRLRRSLRDDPEMEVNPTPLTMSLDEGKAVKYRNTVENAQTIDPPDDPRRDFSHMVPRQSVTTWDNDVLASPHSSELARNYARQRIDRGQSGSVGFPSPRQEGGQTQPPLPFDREGVHKSLPGAKITQGGRRTLSSIQFETKND